MNLVNRECNLISITGYGQLRYIVQGLYPRSGLTPISDPRTITRLSVGEVRSYISITQSKNITYLALTAQIVYANIL